MAFHKTGDVPIQKIMCSCGQELHGVIGKCPKCGKVLIPDDLQTPMVATPISASPVDITSGPDE